MATKSENSYYDANISPTMDDFDNENVFNDILNLDDQPLFQDNWNSLQDTPPYEPDVLFSTPNSWDAPQMRTMPKLEPVQVVHPNQLGIPQQQHLPAATPLSPAQQELLRSIAMPEHLQYNAQAHSPQSITSTTYKSGSVSSPDHHDLPRKRKSSTEDLDDDHSGDESVQRPVKKTAHNMIEKRYRTNLNDKIAALRDSVPSLRVMAKGARGEDGEKEDLQGLTPAHKLNKATVLAKATEYIRKYCNSSTLNRTNFLRPSREEEPSSSRRECYAKGANRSFREAVHSWSDGNEHHSTSDPSIQLPTGPMEW